MDTSELITTLQKLNIKVTNKMLAELWCIDITSVSRKKKNKTVLNIREIEKIEKAFNVDLREKKYIESKKDDNSQVFTENYIRDIVRSELKNVLKDIIDKL